MNTGKHRHVSFRRASIIGFWNLKAHNGICNFHYKRPQRDVQLDGQRAVGRQHPKTYNSIGYMGTRNDDLREYALLVVEHKLSSIYCARYIPHRNFWSENVRMRLSPIGKSCRRYCCPNFLLSQQESRIVNRVRNFYGNYAMIVG